MTYKKINTEFFKSNFFVYIVQFIITCIIVTADFITKSMILRDFQNSTTEHYIKVNNFLNIVYVKNYGVVFGILNTAKYQNLISSIFLLINFLLIMFIIFIYSKSIKKISEKIILSFVIGGAIGNWIDRLKNGFVIDFLDVHYIDIHWYVFNIADICVSTGIIMLLISQMISKKNNIYV